MYGWSEDAYSSLTDVATQAQERVGMAGLFALAMLAGVGLLFANAGRPAKRARIWK